MTSKKQHLDEIFSNIYVKEAKLYQTSNYIGCHLTQLNDEMMSLEELEYEQVDITMPNEYRVSVLYC